MLVVDDDPNTCLLLQDYFEVAGYDVTVSEDSQRALDLVLQEDQDASFDIIVLDANLPGKSGWNVLQEMQMTDIGTPVVMLTACDEPASILKGFSLGIDDYVVKPFMTEELAARIRAILHRTQPANKTPMTIYQIGDVEINFTTHEAQRDDGQSIWFTALELDILRYLIYKRGETVSRKELLQKVWGISEMIITRTIDRHVSSIRKKIEARSRTPKFIETIYGIGYRLNM